MFISCDIHFILFSTVSGMFAKTSNGLTTKLQTRSYSIKYSCTKSIHVSTRSDTIKSKLNHVPIAITISLTNPM